MRDYLRRLAGGNFIYENPKLHFSQELIELSITEGSVSECSFEILATDAVKGIVWSSNERVRLENEMFSGTDCKISYTVDATGLSCGASLCGTFDVVSSCGEAQLSYEIKIVHKYVAASCGEASNLFHFTGLAQEAPEEALALFEAEEFPGIFLREEPALLNIYKLLKKDGCRQEAMEEFLIAARKKEAVAFKAADEKRSYIGCSQNRQDIIEIEKSGWGYIELEVSADCDFIRLENTHITSDDFVGNRYGLSYIIDADRLHAGKNAGRIIIASYNRKIAAEIEAYKDTVEDSAGEAQKQADGDRQERKLLCGFTENYLAYRLKKIDTGDWLERSNSILDRLRTLDFENRVYKLMQAYVYIAQKRQQDGEALLSEIQIDKGEGELYCYYLYVKSMAAKNASYTAKAASVIKDYFSNGYDDWRILWIRFYVDSAFGHNQSIKLLRIKEAFHKGCTSPVMYMEALSVMNSQPVLVRVLDRFELQVIGFGCRRDAVEEKLALHVAELALSDKNVSAAKLSLLKKLYKIFDRDEILTSLISYMIRGGQAGREDFEFYEKGVLRGIKITRLYEYYLKSIDKNRYARLPKIVLMYFAYDSSLDCENKSYLYANILENESASQELMNIYIPQIEKFAYEQLRQKRVNDHLLVIYKKFWSERYVDDETSAFMLSLMYTYRVKCYERGTEYVWVKHKEFERADRYELVDSKAFVPLYTENSSLLFETASGRFHKDSLRYEVEKVFDDDTLKNMLLEYKYSEERDKKLAAILRFERDNSGAGAYAGVCLLLSDGGLDEEYRKRLNTWLIHFYEDFYQGDDFDREIERVDSSSLNSEDAAAWIYACIKNEAYDEAFSLVRKYGYENVSPTALFSLARNMLARLGGRADRTLTALCFYVFENKKYNEDVLKFLADNYNGTNDQMYRLWKACRNFKTETKDLEERLLAQMIFTAQHNGRMTEIFGAYLNSGGNRMIITAYVAYQSYLYFVKQRKANEIVFKVIEELLEEDRELPDVCALSYLKYNSSHPDKLTGSRKELAKKLIYRLCSRDKCFEFYKKYAGVISLPYNITDRTFVSYIGNPEAKVEIHYWVSGDETEITEVVTNCGGIFVKGFTLFYSDSIKYYFTEETGGSVKKSELFHLQKNNINEDGTEGRFDYINDMLASRELHDMVTMKKLMHGYCVQDYVAQQIFKPMESV